MWIFCGGMQRAGSTLQFQIVSKIVEDFNLGKRVEFETADDFPALIKRYGSYDKLKVYKSHFLTDVMKSEIDRGNAKVVYIYRDIRDVVVSLMHKKEKSFSHIKEKKLIENILSEYEKWTRMQPIHSSRYESVISDMKSEIINIGCFLGVSLKQDYITDTEHFFSIDNQKKRIEAFVQRGEFIERENLSEIKKKFDPETLLHHNHISKYEKAGWQHNLSTEEVASIERIAGGWLKENGYSLIKND